MKLYFLDSSEHEYFIAEIETAQECFKEINKYLESRHFKSYYIRIWTDPDEITWFDFGSHTEFFIAKGTHMNDFSNTNRGD